MNNIQKMIATLRCAKQEVRQIEYELNQELMTLDSGIKQAYLQGIIKFNFTVMPYTIEKMQKELGER